MYNRNFQQVTDDVINIINRRGEKRPLDFNRIQKRLNTLINMRPKLHIHGDRLAQKTISQMANDMTTYEIDILSSKICGSLVTEHPDYNLLASRIMIDNLHKETSNSFLITIQSISEIENENGDKLNLIHPVMKKMVNDFDEEIQNTIDYNKDFMFDYFGINTLIKSYLIKDLRKKNNNILERPQHLWMRVALGLHIKLYQESNKNENFNREEFFNEVKSLYNYLSDGYYTHATPTLFNAGIKQGSLSSCFLLDIPDDLKGIYKVLADTAIISKWSGGIGINVTKVRANGTIIKSTNGKSDGIIPMLKVFNNSAVYVNQGGGKRKGSVAVYIEPWHADIQDFLDLKKPIGDENKRTRDLFLALWIPDIFMKRLIKAIENRNEIVMWSLMCPYKCPKLVSTHSEEFEKNYLMYEEKEMFNKQINILTLWQHILEIQMESGTPYLMFKDHVNKKCNQNNLGTINCSNLCSEITIYTDQKQTGVCNLASICLNKCVVVKKNTTQFDYKKLFTVVKQIVVNLNKVIDNNTCYVKEGIYSDSVNRPIGIGVQGLGTVFMMLKLSFTSEKAKEINRYIFETIYFAALTSSCELAKLNGAYKNYEGSMISKGQFQFELYEEKPQLSGMWDWEKLRKDILQYGVYNSLLVALMPTASTASIMGNTENFEPITSNMYMRNVLSGNFQIVNKFLINDLLELNIWNSHIKQQIIADEGSVQNIDEIPEHLKEVYKTVWEYKLSDLIKMDADRSKFVCQSMSSNRYVSNCSSDRLTNIHILCWRKELKTSNYYIRTKTVMPVKFTIDPNIKNNTIQQNNEPDECMVCSA